MVDIEIRYFDGCPNWVETEALVKRVAGEIGIEASVTYKLVETQEDAERLAFRGSPTLLIDGVDPWDSLEAPVGLSCRVYRSEVGFSGTPTETQVEAALRGTE
jgi:hypothetical protein